MCVCYFWIGIMLKVVISLRSGCKNSMNHAGEGLNHKAKHRCRYSVQYDNRVYTCKVSCELPMVITSHVGWGVTSLCSSSFQACYEGGKEVIVIPKTSASSDSPWMGLAKYAWSGYITVTFMVILQLPRFSHLRKTICLLRYVIECPNCGVIYRSRQYWYGNQDPVDTVVRTEIKHVWPGVKTRQLNPFISRL